MASNTGLSGQVAIVTGGGRGIGRSRWAEPEMAARLVVLLASGKADVLSGRFFGIRDDLDELVLRAEEIGQKDLYALRIRKF
ncbi:MAG TPA: hypothetical protein VLA02_17115 [Reyranella sp.]|nr:hypothetical protein [Reyranella sp.]